MKLVLLGAAALLVFCGFSFAAEVPVRPYRDYLDVIGRKLDCYFTIEDCRPTNKLTELSQAKIRADPLIGSKKDLIAKLTLELPNVDVFQDDTNVAVIHIMAKAISSENDYALKNTCNIDFDGALSGLPSYLGEQMHVPLDRFKIESVGVASDYTTNVRVKFQNKTVRSVLTDAVPLAGYSRVIWFAETLTYEGKRQTWVRFSGPAAWNSIRYGLKPPVPFSDGEAAFAVNSADPATIKSAIGFLQTELKKTSPRQIRWAMFWMGEHQVREAIPYLLGAIDYRYTDASFPVENYPALRALMVYGDNGAKAAADALKKESEPARRSLLLQLIIQIKGKKVAPTFLKSALTAGSNPMTNVEAQRLLEEMQKLNPNMEKTDLLSRDK